MILGGDIGGTHTRLALFDDDGTALAERPSASIRVASTAGSAK